MILKTAVRLIDILPKPIKIFAARVLVNAYVSKYAEIKIINKDRLSRLDGPVIFISNHLSNSDGIVLNKVLKNKSVWFVAGVKLAKTHLTNIGRAAVRTISINPSSADKSAISSVIKLLKSGQSICIFPEGTRSRDGSLIEAKKGIILIARLSKVPIVPIGIEGTERLLPINDEDMGREKLHHSEVKVTIGESFYIPQRNENEDKETYEQRALYYTMRRIAELLPEKYQGVYKE